MYDNGSEFKMDFEYLCESYGIKRKQTMIKNTQVNAILECVHQILTQMLRTAELDVAKSVTPNDVDVFLDNAAWAIRSTYCIVFKASPGAAIFGCDMLFDILFITNWNKIGDYGQHHTDLNTARKSSTPVDYDYKIGDKVLLRQDGILRKAECPYSKKPWTITTVYWSITTVYMNGTIRIQCKKIGMT
jgi:hypothetical protein